MLLSVTSQVQNLVTERYKDSFYNHWLVDVMHSKTHRKKEAVKDILFSKGFSDLIVHALQCNLQKRLTQVFGLRT